MSKLNVRQPEIQTHEGCKAQHINPEFQLRRSVMSCMLWEREFYEDGISIADRIAQTIPFVKSDKVAEIAIEARERMKLRHVPLLIVREMARTQSHKRLVAETLTRIIQRPDELAEFLSIYWKGGRQPLSAQVKRGLAFAFGKFDEYQLAKYNRDGAIKLRDVLFLCHAKPKDKEQEALWKKLVDNKLAVPDTWEVNLSSGKDKKETFERLLKENKLGALALLRNLRNMAQSGVDESIIFDSLCRMNVSRVLPFRFISAAKYAPQWEPQIEEGLMRCLAEKEKMSGKTVILVDVSGSMDAEVSSKSEITRMDAACGVAMLARELCDARIVTFSNEMVEVPARRGFALRDAIVNSQMHQGTYLGQAVSTINERIPAERLIIITDEQAHDSAPAPKAKGYVINVASNKNGVGYGAWTHVDGFSENVLDYIRESETNHTVEQ